MISTLRHERAVMGVGWDEEYALAQKIVAERASELADDEAAALCDAGREEALTYVLDPQGAGAALLEHGLFAAAGRALQRKAAIEPDPDADENDVADDLKALLNLLAFGLVRLAREEG
jgi:hypothetical protein